MTPSVSPQNALIDCAIFVATVFATVALILRTSVEAAAWGDSGHGTLQHGAEQQSPASRPSAAATREGSDECALST